MTPLAISAIPAPPRRRMADRLRSFAGGVVLLAATVAALVMLVPAVLGYERYVILSGSMSGTYDRGSVVYAKEVPVDALTPGDVITYAPPAGMAPYELVTHRVVDVQLDPAGKRVFRTRGDANPAVDPWRFSLDQAAQAKVRFGVPFVGYAFAALGDRQVRMGVIGLPAVLIALMSIWRFVRDTRRDARVASPAPIV